MFGIRIVIADKDAAYRQSLKEEFRLADYLVVGEASDARTALQIIFQAEPHVVVMDPYIPGGEGIELTGIIDDHRVAPVVAVVSQVRGEVEDFARLPGVYGLLMKPLQSESVRPVIESALVNFNRAMKLEKELKDLRRELENRKIIEIAKGLLMERKKLTEKDAYKYLQKVSMDRCVPLDRVARSVIMRCRREGGGR
ncbi:MAG: ANTAR domain-containing protein [Peptococcaceae bacterium]|nr:ANTAR domain-containing protein [Peptococcaceae bacterium]